MSRAKNLANFQTTITDGTTSVATSFVTNGSAKAYMLFDGSANTIKKSLNIASLTDNGTGQHDGNFISNMDSINFSALACSRTGGGAGDKQYTNPNSAGNVDVTMYNSGGSFVDNSQVSIAVFGDLA